MFEHMFSNRTQYFQQKINKIEKWNFKSKDRSLKQNKSKIFWDFKFMNSAVICLGENVTMNDKNKLLEKARIELGEDEIKKRQGIAHLRAWTKSQPNIRNCRQGESSMKVICIEIGLPKNYHSIFEIFD
jgi:hypothetical protein